MTNFPYIVFNNRKQNYFVVVNEGYKIECANFWTAKYYKKIHQKGKNE